MRVRLPPHAVRASVHDGRVNLRQIGRYSDERVIEQLTTLKGAGRWTAQMFLIFALGRFDVFPRDNQGVRAAIKDRYGFAELPDKDTCSEIVGKWRLTHRLETGIAGDHLTWGRTANPMQKATPRSSIPYQQHSL